MAVLRLCSQTFAFLFIITFDGSKGRECNESFGLTENTVDCECNAGYQRTQDVHCIPCEPGTFKDGVGNSTCLPCPAGSFTADFGSRWCSACLGASYSAQGASVCTECGAHSATQTEKRKEYLVQYCSSDSSGDRQGCATSIVVGPYTELRLTVRVEQTDFDHPHEVITSVTAGGEAVHFDPIDTVIGGYFVSWNNNRYYYFSEDSYDLSEDDTALAEGYEFQQCGTFITSVSNERVEAEWIDGEWVLDVAITASNLVNSQPCNGLFLNARVEVEVTRPLQSGAEDCGCEQGYGWSFAHSCLEVGGVEAEGSSVCFFLGEEGATLADATKACAVFGAQLASILSAKENQAVVKLLSASKLESARIGLTDDALYPASSANNFHWIDGSARPFFNWAPREPNDWGQGEHCTLAQSSGQWNDVGCDQSVPTVCAMRPELPPAGGACVECEAGKYSAGSVCVACPAGTYAAGAGATACEACAGGESGRGSFALGGASSCSECVGGSLQDEGASTRREMVVGGCALSSAAQLGAACATSVPVGQGGELRLTVKVEQGDFDTGNENIRFVRVGGEAVPFEGIGSLTYYDPDGVGTFHSHGDESWDPFYYYYFDWDRPNANFARCGHFITIVDRMPVRAEWINGQWWVDVEVGATWGVDQTYCDGVFLNVQVEVEAMRATGTSGLDCECDAGYERSSEPGHCCPDGWHFQPGARDCAPWGAPALVEACQVPAHACGKGAKTRASGRASQ